MLLLEPTKLGSMNLVNRMFMAPMTRNRADNLDAAPTELHVEYYRQRAGAGLMITEGTVVSQRRTGYLNVPGIYSETQTDSWKKVTQAVHETDGRIFCQLWDVGRLSHPDFHQGQLPVVPSSLNPDTEVFTKNGKTRSVTPKELSVDEIKSTVQDFKKAADNAIICKKVPNENHTDYRGKQGYRL